MKPWDDPSPNTLNVINGLPAEFNLFRHNTQHKIKRPGANIGPKGTLREDSRYRGDNLQEPTGMNPWKPSEGCTPEEFNCATKVYAVPPSLPQRTQATRLVLVALLADALIAW